MFMEKEAYHYRCASYYYSFSHLFLTQQAFRVVCHDDHDDHDA